MPEVTFAHPVNQERLEAAEAKLKRLVAESRAVNDKIEAAITADKDADTKAIRGRGLALMNAIAVAETEVAEAKAAWEADLGLLDMVTKGLNDGTLVGEPGDGAVPIQRPAPGSFSVKGQTLTGLTAAMMGAGFDLRRNPSVKARNGEAILKASTFPATTDWQRARPTELVAMGRDQRWLWPLLPSEQAGDDLSVADYRQTGRTLTGTVQRATTATTDKATLDVALSLVTEAIPQHAIVIPDIPNALFTKVRQLQAFLQSEATFQINADIDSHVFAQIVAATPPFGNTGTTLIDKVRNGIAAIARHRSEPERARAQPH
ncbi:MAG: hypothetical protein QM733_18940 [Ilumatobacteraceae bacterium]